MNLDPTGLRESNFTVVTFPCSVFNVFREAFASLKKSCLIFVVVSDLVPPIHINTARWAVAMDPNWTGRDDARQKVRHSVRPPHVCSSRPCRLRGCSPLSGRVCLMPSLLPLSLHGPMNFTCIMPEELVVMRSVLV